MYFFSHKIQFLLIIGFFVATFFPGNTAGETNQTGIKIMHKERLGRFLATGDGMTLYSYAKDGNNISNCLEGCAANWPPFYADPSSVIEGCEASDFDTIIRDDKKKQTTYKQTPLYRFINDRYPNDTLGQGIGNVWFIVNPDK